MRRCRVLPFLSTCLAFLFLSCQAIVGLDKKELPPADAVQESDMSAEVELDGVEEGHVDPGPDPDPDPDPDTVEDPDPDVDDAADIPDPDAFDIEEELPIAAFRDDFDAAALDPGWTFVDPVGDCSYSLALSPGCIVFSLPGSVTHDC